MIKAFLSLGTNLDNRTDNMNKMVKACTSLLQPPIILSKLMETEPIATPDEQQWYYNRIICGNYEGTVRDLLVRCQTIEKGLGRSENSHLKERTADVDILMAGDLVINEHDLIVPHPEILNRRFCLLGISEIAPEQIHPVIKAHFSELIKHMNKHVIEQRINFLDL